VSYKNIIPFFIFRKVRYFFDVSIANILKLNVYEQICLYKMYTLFQ